MSIITLTTDLGLKDHYVASLKGRIYSQLPSAKVIDITHLIDKHNIVQAAFTLKNAYKDFPEGSVHIIGVKPLVDSYSQHVVVCYDNHYFIGADNGIFSLIFDQPVQAIYSIRLQVPVESLAFPTKYIFAPSACHILKGGKPELLGQRLEGIREMVMVAPIVNANFIRGVIQYIDSFGNLISNIKKEVFYQACQNRPFSINLRSSNFSIRKISQTYNNVPEGELVALFGANDYLEIAIHSGPANSLLGLKFNDLISIDFYDS